MKKKLIVGLPILILALGVGSYIYAQHRARQTVDEFLTNLVKNGHVQEANYGDLQLALNGDLHITNLELRNPNATMVLQTVTLSDIDYDHPEPWHVKIHAENLHFPNGLPNLQAFSNPYLTAIAHNLIQNDTLLFTLDYAYLYEQATENQILTACILTLPNLFVLTSDSETRNVPLSSFFSGSNEQPPTTNSFNASTAFAAAKFPHVSLSLQDSGLVNHMIEAVASNTGATTTDSRSQLQLQAKTLHLLLPPGAQQFGMSLGNALATFLDGGHSMTLSLQPEYDGSIAQLQPAILGSIMMGNVEKAVALLHLQIETH